MTPAADARSRGRRASAGGARAAGGIDNQARVAAWLTSLLVTDQPIPWLLTGGRLEAIGGDTGLAIDDVGAVTADGGLVAIQAKGGLTLDTRSESAAFPAAVAQAVDQFLSGVPDGEQLRPVDPARDRLVILGSSTSSQPVRALRSVTARLRTLPGEAPLDSVATNAPQMTALLKLRSEIERAWTTLTGSEPSNDEVRALLRVLVVDVLDLDDGGRDRATAIVHLQSVLLDAANAGAAWTELVELGRTLSVERSWRRRPELAAHLAERNTPVGPAANYLADVRRLQSVSNATLQTLGEHSSVTVAGHEIHCERKAATDLATADGSFVIVGAPGCGKSGVIYKLAHQLADEDIVVLGVESLSRDAGSTRENLGLRHGLPDVFRQWSGPARATLILDGLDAARGEATAWLSDLVTSLRGTRWRVIASIRKFDLQHSPRWQRAFGGDSVATGSPTDSGLRQVRHYLLGDLTDDELDELMTSSQDIAELLNGAPPHLLDLVRNPFNLRLALELLELGEPTESLASTRDQLQLLQRYWKRRVEAGAGARSRGRALSALVGEMLRTRQLRASDSVVPVGLDEAVDTLLHDGVLQEVPTILRASGSPVLVFSHNILFDYAAAALVLVAGDRSQLTERLREDPDLAVIARPSIDLHLADLWHADATRSLFAGTLDNLVADDQVLAGVAAARVAIENTTVNADTYWLGSRFEDGTEGALTITSWICAAMNAAEPSFKDRLPSVLAAWADLTETATKILQQQFNQAVAQAAWRLLSRVCCSDR